MTKHASDDLWSEIAYLGYHLHWDVDKLLDMEHGDRQRMVDAVANLNQRAWEAVRNYA